MSRYKIATKTDTLRYKIAKEVFGEIEDSDGVRDIPSWEIFEKCLEQHKRIAELEEQLKNIKEKYVSMINENVIAFDKLEKELANAIVPKFKIGQEVWCVYEYWWNGKFADESNKFAINNFIIDAINIDKYGQHYIFHKEYEGRDNIICYQPNFNGNRFDVMSGVKNHYIDDYYLFTTKEEAQAKLEKLKGENK